MQHLRNADDEYVVSCAREGDAAAFGELVDRYKDKALSLAIRLLKNEHDAEDALQDAFVKSYRSLSSFRSDASFSTWFYRIVYTTCLNALKKRSRSQLLTTFDDELFLDTSESSAHQQFDRVLDETVVQQAIADVLSNMPPLYAVVMDLFYVQERSYEEIVSITSMPLGTVKTRLNRGRQALRQELIRKIPELEPWITNA